MQISKRINNQFNLFFAVAVDKKSLIGLKLCDLMLKPSTTIC